MNTADGLPLTIDDFENGDLDPDEFDHEAHVYAGWLYLQRYPVPEAISRFDAALKRLVHRLGIPDKYHATITWFFLLLIAERRARQPGADWAEFRRRNHDIVRSGRILRRYYDTATLSSARARTAFLLPDRLAGQDGVPTGPRTDLRSGRRC